ncbi:Transcription factor mbp1 [Podospora bellae-mahoneyi]|uniref:Transcription factor mbp1 n=1 Tax=Podospora bellae-mahoneyi TaxID=2093777 RepID=A0ABR0FV94_9PEZI|nr:Transcription factor mbp1 [Podospora bellae-mahoneyi]
MAKGAAPAGVYSATYSGVPVYEFQFGTDLKEHVMRRRADNWVNATHILKAAGFDKPARTRILEREVQKEEHEKVQGGYGKYQGTWIPLEQGEALAQRNNIYERLRPIFEYEPGSESPPPAPRHASKPKAPKAKPAVPKWGSKSQNRKSSLSQSAVFSHSHAQQGVPVQEEYESVASQIHEDDTPDNMTVASASYMAEDDRAYDMSHFSTGHRKRKREEEMRDMTAQQHAMYGDELLDYFLLSTNQQAAIRPDPPTNFQPDWPIDTDRHTSLHWASAMGDTDVIKQLKRFDANLMAQNIRGETPLMWAVNFTNCYMKKTFPTVLNELFKSVDARDHSGCTVIHHAAVMKRGRVQSSTCARYYLDIILNKLVEVRQPEEVQALLDAQDEEGNTALHLAARVNARKCIRSLLGRGAATDIENNEGVRAEDLIKEINTTRSLARTGPQRSSSPFAPETARRNGFRDALGEDPTSKLQVSYQSEAANTVQSRITPLVLQKLQDLSQSYDSEFNEMDEAEKEARHILANTQAELNNLRASIAELESRIEADDQASKTEEEVAAAKKQVLALFRRQTQLAIEKATEQNLASVTNGQQQEEEDDSPEERLKLAAQLHAMLVEQEAAEVEYVEARGMLGTGKKIDQYRHLLCSCLPPEDQDMLDQNLEDMISMMEDEAESNSAALLPPGTNPDGVMEGMGMLGGMALAMAEAAEPMEITG